MERQESKSGDSGLHSEVSNKQCHRAVPIKKFKHIYDMLLVFITNSNCILNFS